MPKSDKPSDTASRDTLRKGGSNNGRGGTSLRSVQKRFPTEDDVVRHIFEVRQAELATCPLCSRPLRLEHATGTRNFTGACCKQITRSVTKDTLFENSSWPLRSWVSAMVYFANSRSGVATSFIQAMYGLNRSTAEEICHRIRWHMALLEGDRTVGGPGVPVGLAFERVAVTGQGSSSRKRSDLVLAMYDASHIVTAVVPNRRSKSVGELVQAKVREGSILVERDRDELLRPTMSRDKSGLSRRFKIDPLAHHRGIDSAVLVFWMHFRRVMAASHRDFEKDELQFHLGEFAFRFNRRSEPDRAFWDMISRFPRLEQESRPGAPAV